jgi:DNA-binding MarR family transcriptional regulator
MPESIPINQTFSQWVDILTNHAMHNQIRYVKAAGLSMPQFGILMHLYYGHSCGVSEVSDHMEITAAAASQLVEKLVQSGLVERSEDPDDRRAKVLQLSAKGRTLIENGITERSRWVDDLIAGLDVGEREIVSQGLEILVNAANKMKEERIK